MPKKVLDDAFVSINGVDLSDHVKSVTLNYSAEMLDDTAMGDDTKSSLGGLKNWSAEVEFHQDYAAASVDATLFPLVGATFVFIARADKSDGVSATNPNYTATGVLASYTPLGGSHGELMATSVSINPAGGANATLTRATA